MRIGIDASRAVGGERTGTENYSLHLIQAILSLEGVSEEHEFILYFNQAPETGLFPESPHCKMRVIPFPRLWSHLRLSLEMVLGRPDVLFVPAHVIPLVHPSRSVVTVHDLGHLFYPDTYPPSALRYLSWATAHNISSAAHIIADSRATQEDIIKHFGADPSKIAVVYPGVGPQFRPVQDEREMEAIKERYGIKGEYFLYVGTIHPRKNLERLLEAYGLLKKAGKIKHSLVLVGKKGWLPEATLKKLQEVEGEVTLTGFVPQEDLPALYAGATALVFPSLFEGFGMPALEAMACGTPVIASYASSLPEVVGDCGLLVDPMSTQEMADAMAWLVEHEEYGRELRARGQVRAKDFTWEKAAQKTLEVLEAAGKDKM